MAFRVNGIEYYHWQTLYSSHLEAVIMFFFLRGGQWHLLWWSWGLDCQAGTPEGHLPHRSGDHFHIHDSWGLVLYNAASTHHSHHRFKHQFWLCGLKGYLKGSCRWKVPLQAGHYLLEAQGQGNYLHWLQRLRWGWVLLWLLDLQVLFHPLALSSPCLRTPVLVPLPGLTKGQRGLSSSSDWPGGVQHFLPTEEPVWGNLYLCLLLMRHPGCSQFFRGLPMWAASSMATFSVGTSVKVSGASPEMVNSVWFLRNSSGRATLSKTISSEKETYHSIISHNLRADLAKRHGWPGIGGLALSAQYCRVWA